MLLCHGQRIKKQKRNRKLEIPKKGTEKSGENEKADSNAGQDLEDPAA